MKFGSFKAVFHFNRILAKRSVFYCVHIISSFWVLTKQWNTVRFAVIQLKWKTTLIKTGLRFGVCAAVPLIYRSTFFQSKSTIGVWISSKTALFFQFLVGSHSLFSFLNVTAFVFCLNQSLCVIYISQHIPQHIVSKIVATYIAAISIGALKWEVFLNFTWTC